MAFGMLICLVLSTVREMNKIYMKDFTRNSLMQVLDRQSPNASSGFVATNTLFAYLDFGREPHAHATEDGFIHARGVLQDQRSSLFKHPIAYRSFATFVPTSSVQLLTLGSIPLVQNPSGVTVWDIFTAVQSTYVTAVGYVIPPNYNDLFTD